MFKFAWNIFGVVGLIFVLTLYSNPSLIPGASAIAHSYWNRTLNNIQLAVEEWKRDK
jgi:hypothetical protein